MIYVYHKICTKLTTMFFSCTSDASCKAAATAAPDEIPQKTPSFLAKVRAVQMAFSLLIYKGIIITY